MRADDAATGHVSLGGVALRLSIAVDARPLVTGAAAFAPVLSRQRQRLDASGLAAGRGTLARATITDPAAQIVIARLEMQRVIAVRLNIRPAIAASMQVSRAVTARIALETEP